MKTTASAGHPRVKPSRSWRALAVCLGVALAASLAWFHFAGKRGPQARPEPAESSRIRPGSPPAAGVRPELAAALGIAGGASPGERLHLLRQMDGPLSQPDAQAALSPLLARPGAEAPPGWHAEYIHEICLMLRRCGAAGGDFARALLTLAGDADRPLVIRDYALQHLASVWAAPELAGLRPEITAALHDMFQTGPPLAAPALLALHRLGDAGAPPGTDVPVVPGVPGERLAAMAAGVLASPSGDTATRMAAIRIVADRRLAGQRAALKAIAAADSEPTVLRMAAVAAIGRFGDPADMDFIASVPAAAGSPLAEALRHAGQSIAPAAK